jgi:hypothetical protein
MEQLLNFAPFVDLLLAGALFYFAIKAFKQQGNGVFLERTEELEKSLRMLIGEAERAGSGFNEALLSKRSELEKLLFDIQSAEHRVSKVVEESEEERKLARIEIERLKSNPASKGGSSRNLLASATTESQHPEQVQRNSAMLETQHAQHGVSIQYATHDETFTEPMRGEAQASQLSPQQYRESEESHERIRIPANQPETAAEVPQQRELSKPEPAHPLLTRRDREEPTIRPAVFPRINSEIQRSEQDVNRAKPNSTSNIPLRERIEIERTPQVNSDSEHMSRVLRAAETLLRAGLNVAQVSERTNLPKDEVAILARNLAVLEQSTTEQSPIRRRREQL